MPKTVKENRLPYLRDVLNGQYDGVNEPTGSVTLDPFDFEAYQTLTKAVAHKLEKNKDFTGKSEPQGGGGHLVPVKDLLLAIKSVAPDAVIEVDVPSED